MDHQSTKAFSAQLGIKQESIHARLSQFGSYYGVIPTKLPNGRLAWPAGDALEIVKHQGKGTR